MALLKCPDCGNEVSEKAKACPKCGCPIEYCEIIPQYEKKASKVDTQISSESDKAERIGRVFEINGCELPIMDGLAFYCTTRKQFEESASMDKLDFYDYYRDNIKLYSDIYSKGMEYVENEIYRECSEAMHVLSDCVDIDTYDTNRIYRMLLEQYPLEQYLQFVIQQRAEIEEALDALKGRKREQRNMSGGWVGGGFGVKGAIKGALTASVMNAGTKMVRGAAFAAGNTYTQSSINKRKQSLPNDIRTVLSLKNALYYGVCNIGECLYGIIAREMKIPPITFNNEQSVSRVKIALEGYQTNRLSRQEATAKICKSIYENPYYFWFYKELYELNKECEAEILELADWLGIGYEIDRIINNIKQGRKHWDEPEISYKH